MDKLREAMTLMADIPKAQRLYSTKYWPTEKATQFTHDGDEYVIAHPSLWNKIPLSVNTPLSGLWGLKVRDLDHPAFTDDRAQVFDALARVLMSATEPTA